MNEPTIPVHTPKLCGRPTRSGRPCRQRISDPRFETSCRQHATDAESELATARRIAYYEGYRNAQEAARQYESFRIEWLEKRIQELEHASRPPRRVTDPIGRQIVEVGGLAYAWDGDQPLAVGDAVWLPENYVSRIKHGPGRHRGEVTALGTHYTDALSTIVGRA